MYRNGAIYDGEIKGGNPEAEELVTALAAPYQRSC